VLAERAWASEDALENQVVTVGAQLSEVSISESALEDQVAYTEDQLDEARMRVSKIEVKLDSARGSKSALKDKLTNVEMELSETTIAKNELQEQVFDVAAQLDAAMMSESTSEEVADLREQLDEARKKVTSIEEELDDARMSNFMLQDETDGTNELLDETTALYNKVGNIERELRDSRNSEQVLQQEVNEYAAIIRTIQNAGIYIEKYYILANVEVTPIVDDVTRSFGACLDAAAAADTTTFTSSSEAKSTSLPAIEFEPVINTAQTTLNPFASPFSFDTTSTFSPAVAIEVESLVTTPLVTEITTSVESGLGDSQYATAPASVSSPAIEPKSPVTKITTPVKGGLGASKFAPETKSNASPASAVAIKPAASETTTLSGLGSSKYATASIFNSWPAAEVKPAVNKTTILGGLGSSNHAAAPASNSSPAIEAKTATAKVTTPRLGGLTASKYSDVKPASPALPASNQTPAKNAVVNEPGSSWIQPPGLGEAINLEDYQEKLHCIICAKKVTIEFQFDYGKKFYLWELHQRDFHSKCPDCHKTVPAIWDDKTNGHDFSEHHKVCAVLPAGWAICKFCHEKTPAPLISTPEGRIHDFSKHNTTCPTKAEEKTVHFHCKNCGMGVTDKNDFFKNHKKSCDAKASANGMWYIYDGNTGAFVGPQPAMPTQTTPPKTATPHGTMANLWKQPESATTSSRTPPTGQRGGKAPASERRPALPLFCGRGSHSPTTPQVTASPSW
jgi:predicted  nucleic acid-binding Zn-ribbon protein